ncbi:hypothetical protein AAFF_G00240300 [Aldrovandia affinis]|uniref:Dysbindin n=1 Tax=Aldrovandia affinis TaxID=143900 RepID=A0AAD7SUH9_9TELE|nr:hypothetical protein AAFF_G00240300 [Aldrovandia affinis]
MSSSGSTNHNKRLSSETEHAQRVLDVDAAQHVKLRERQRFFEEVFQNDVDVYLSTTHLQIEHKRPPIGSVSSMEVNVDMLEQMDLMDISDQEALDVFLNSGGDEGVLASPLAEEEDDDKNEGDKEVYKDRISLQVPSGCCETKSRMSSTSSGSTDTYSLDTSEEGPETPVVQSDEEDVQADTFLLVTTPSDKDEEEEEDHNVCLS